MLSFQREIGFFRNLVEAQVAEDHFSFEQVKSCSPPSGGRFWYRVPSKEQGKGPPETSPALAGRRKCWKGPERTKRAGTVSRTEDASGGQVLLLARHASENALRTPVGCPQSVEPAVLRAFEDASRTREGCFWHRVPQKTPSVQKKGVFMHRMPFPYRRSLF